MSSVAGTELDESDRGEAEEDAHEEEKERRYQEKLAREEAEEEAWYANQYILRCESRTAEEKADAEAYLQEENAKWLRLHDRNKRIHANQMAALEQKKQRVEQDTKTTTTTTTAEKPVLSYKISRQ